MAEAGDRVCSTILFSGMVQGVGFRYQTERVARSFDVTGYVRNTHDGHVEVVAEGRPGAWCPEMEIVASLPAEGAQTPLLSAG